MKNFVKGINRAKGGGSLMHDEQSALVHADQACIEKILAGDIAKYSELVRKHQQVVFQVALRFMKDEDMAQDVAQETFIKAFENLSSFEGRSQFKSWLLKICINSARNRMRSKREYCDYEESGLAVLPRAESELINISIKELLAKCIDGLPFKQKTALLLRIYEDLSFKEIAEIMECPYDTAKANFRHALLRLKEELKDQHELHSLWASEPGAMMTEFTSMLEVEV